MSSTTAFPFLGSSDCAFLLSCPLPWCLSFSRPLSLSWRLSLSRPLSFSLPCLSLSRPLSFSLSWLSFGFLKAGGRTEALVMVFDLCRTRGGVLTGSGSPGMQPRQTIAFTACEPRKSSASSLFFFFVDFYPSYNAHELSPMRTFLSILRTIGFWWFLWIFVMKVEKMVASHPNCENLVPSNPSLDQPHPKSWIIPHMIPISGQLLLPHPINSGQTPVPAGLKSPAVWSKGEASPHRRSVGENAQRTWKNNPKL